MDQEKLVYFVSRYSELNEDALAELHGRRETLTEEACAALDTVFARRGIDDAAALMQYDTANAPSKAPAPKRKMGRMAAQLVGAMLIMVLASALAQLAPRWVSILVVLSFLAFWLFRRWSKQR